MLECRSDINYYPDADDDTPRRADDTTSCSWRQPEAAGRFQERFRCCLPYKVLSRTCAATCIRKALDSSLHRNGSTSEKNKKHRDAEVKKLVQRKQRKDILDKLAKKRGSGGLFSSSGSPPPTTFKVMLKQNSIRAKAA